MPKSNSLRWKILGGYGLVLCLVGVVSAWAFVALRDLGRATDAILRENYKSILAAERMVEAIERQDSATLLVLLGYEAEGARQFSDNEGPFLLWLGRAKDNVTVPGEEKIVRALEAGYTDYLTRATELRLTHRADQDKARKFYHEAVLPSFKAVRDGCGRLRDVNEQAMVRASDRARAISATARWSGAVTTLAAVALGLAFSLVLSNLLVRPLRQMMAGAKRLSDGDYDVEIQAPSHDELGLLAAEFNRMVRRLKAFRDLDVGRIVAEKVKSEAIIGSIDDGVIVVGPDLQVTGFNPAAARIFGVEPTNALGRHFLEAVRDDRLFARVKQVVERGTAPPPEEEEDLLTVGQGESRRHYQFSILPLLPEEGAMLGVVLVVRDVTRLTELDRLKSEFVMTASHELRTPLTSMGMAVDLLLEDAGDTLGQREQELLAAAHEELQRLKGLVNDLLDLSKIEAGKLELAIVPTPVDAFCQRALAAMDAQARQRGVELAASVPPDLPEVRADAEKITGVLVNLIANALRHVDPADHVRLSAKHVGDRVHVTVADDGTGIPYELQPKIFDKFVRVKTDRDEGGSGLGLSICREIVRAHGGAIWVESTPGEGTSFTFTLPIAQAAAPGDHA